MVRLLVHKEAVAFYDTTIQSMCDYKYEAYFFVISFMRYNVSLVKPIVQPAFRDYPKTVRSSVVLVVKRVLKLAADCCGSMNDAV